MSINYLPRVETLRNVRDVEALVLHCMGKAGMRREIMHDDDHQELFCSGLVLLYQLSDGFREGEGSSFYGYAVTYLPGRLSNAWHGLNEHHVLERGEDGRRWRYYAKAQSLDAPVQSVSTESGEAVIQDRYDTPIVERSRRIGDFTPPPIAVPA